MVSYAAYLLTGHTLLVISVKVATAKLYVKAIVSFFTARKQFNPTLTENCEKIQALDRFWSEGICCPLTPKMVQYLVRELAPNAMLIHPCQHMLTGQFLVFKLGLRSQNMLRHIL